MLFSVSVRRIPPHLIVLILSLVSLLPCITFAQRRPASPVKSKSLPALKGSDVLATVEGVPITRRELTAFWLQADTATQAVLGRLLASRWQADGGAALYYAVPEGDIYRALYASKTDAYANYLSALISSRLVGIEAQRRGIKVTDGEVKAAGHALLDQLRQQRGIADGDDRLLTLFRIPRQVFISDMQFRVQTNKLLALDFARRNGHPLRPDDWVQVRELFAAATTAGASGGTPAQFAAARTRLEGWLAEVRGGKAFAETAQAHNENATNAMQGSLGLTLRGMGTPALEAAIYALKPGEISLPVRGPDGWYVFLLEQRGSGIAEIARDGGQAAWQSVLAQRRETFLAALRRQAHIVSRVPLPAVQPSASAAVPTRPPISREQPPPPPNLQ